MVKVSVLIAVYNNKEDIINAIQSVESQTFDDWELIMVDDYSTDGTYDVVKEYVIDKPKIRLYKNEANYGTYVSFNNALIHARGEYVCVLGSDDAFTPDNLESNVNILDANENMIACRAKYCRNGPKPVTRFGEVTLFYRRKIIDEIGYYDSVRFAADTEFIERVVKKYGKHKIYVLDKITYHAKTRANSLTTSKKTGDRRIRSDYTHNFRTWQYTTPHLYMPFPLVERPFPVHPIMLPVSPTDLVRAAKN